MKLLALVLLLSSFSSWTLTEVVNSFERFCPGFFIQTRETNGSVIPTVFPESQYKKICQRLNNGYRFATVYDTVRRIPVYSAYTFYQADKSKCKNNWKIEPQLEDLEEYKNIKEMIDSPEPQKDAERIRSIMKQAVDSDYKGRGNITRGHLFPLMFAADLNQKESTFTLTNIAPQLGKSNQQWAVEVENKMLKEIKQSCELDESHRAYIVTDIVPGNAWIRIERNKTIHEGINIPTHFWSAFCCTSKKKSFNALLVRTYIACQENFKPRCFNNSQDLNKLLSDLYKRDFQVFPGLNV